MERLVFLKYLGRDQPPRRGMSKKGKRLVDAVQHGDLHTLDELVQSRVALLRLRDTEGFSLVEHAIRADQPQVLDWLLTHQAMEEQDETDRARSPPCVAVELNRSDCLRVLLGHGACVDLAYQHDGTLETALHTAAVFNTTGATLEMVLEASCEIDARDSCENTPLHLAAAYGSLEIAQRLIASGADVNAINASGSTPLHLASPNGFITIVQLLLEHGADVNAKDVLGNSPLIDAAFVRQLATNHFASGNSATQASVIKLLLAFGADVNACNRDGDPAICGAVRNGYTDVIMELLDRGACVSKLNRRMESVLHVAARAGVESVEIWERLLAAGADVLSRDRYDRTCYAIWNSRPRATEARERDHVKGDSDRVREVLEDALLTIQRY